MGAGAQVKNTAITAPGTIRPEDGAEIPYCEIKDRTKRIVGIITFWVQYLTLRDHHVVNTLGTGLQGDRQPEEARYMASKVSVVGLCYFEYVDASLMNKQCSKAQ